MLVGQSKAPWVRRTVALAVAGLVIGSCATDGSTGQGSTGEAPVFLTPPDLRDGQAAGLSPEAAEFEERLVADLVNQTDLTKAIVNDGSVTRAEQEQAIQALFDCFDSSQLEPTSTEWDGVRYQWGVSMGVPEGEEADRRTGLMIECEQKHWDYILSVMSLNTARRIDGDGFDKLMVDCINSKGLNGDGYLAADIAIIETAEAADCFVEVQRTVAAEPASE